MREETKTPIRVVVKLRDYANVGFNKWKCTIHGEERMVTMQRVEWHCLSIEDAVHSFKISEVESFEITGRFN